MEQVYTLITGASSDIGKNICFKLAANEALILHGRDFDKLNQLKNSLPNSDTHLIWQYDFANANNLCADIISFIESNNINIKNIVHVAGIAEFFPVHLLNRQTVKLSFNVNFYSIVDILSVLLKKKYKKSLKCIVLISSVSIHAAAGRGMAAYTSSKSAMEVYAKSIAAEIAPVRINSIALGGIKVHKNDGISQSLDSDISSYPLGIGMPENVADMVSFLLSDNSLWVTGQTFILDGGYSVFRN